MSKKDHTASEKEAVSLEKESRQRIGIFTKNWMESTKLAAGLPNCCLKSWKKMQIVFCEEDIERLLSLNAPIRIFVEYGSN